MKYQVVSNKKISSQYYKLTLTGDHIAQIKPGQFAMLQISPGYDPLLRRPFALHSWNDDGEIEILYQVVGKGTKLMTQLKSDDVVDVLGPLGNGFLLPEENQRVLLVAGAIGTAPLLPLAQELIKRKKYSPDQLKVLIGGRSRGDILNLDDFAALGIEAKIATEDGSMGQKGFVTVPLEEELKKFSGTIFACGPHGMLKAVAGLTQEHKASCQVSMEALMACGVGACQGCVIKVKDGDDFAYQRVCKEGPVFDAKDILWE